MPKNYTGTVFKAVSIYKDGEDFVNISVVTATEVVRVVGGIFSFRAHPPVQRGHRVTRASRKEE
jgi:hypothetical protein